MRLEEDKEYFICDYCESRYFPDADQEGVRLLGQKAAEMCPICQVPLENAAVGSQRMLFCTQCRGMLIPMRVFMDIVETLRAQRDGAPPEVAPLPNPRDLERRLDCPACHNPMDTHPYAGPGNVIIDNCPDCFLNWLDHGELEHIVRASWKGFEDTPEQ